MIADLKDAQKAVQVPLPDNTAKPATEHVAVPATQPVAEAVAEPATLSIAEGVVKPATVPSTDIVAVDSVEVASPEAVVSPAGNDAPPPPPPADTATSTPEPTVGNAQVKKPAVVYLFNPGDAVLARWSEDHKFYNATVLTKTGNPADPIYYVRFKDYDETTSVSGKDIRPPYQVVNAAKKRKAEEELAKTAAVPTRSSLSVITAAPTYYTQEETAKKQKTDEKPKGTASKAYKKMDAKGLEKQRSSWEDWQTNSKWAKKNKKDSMFRVGEGHKARVGFVGSGKEMTKEEKRKKSYRKDEVEELKKVYAEEEVD